MVAISRSSALIGFHDQFLSLLIFLPSATRRTALLELLPREVSGHNDYAHIYPSLCRVQDVKHFLVTAPLAPGCAALDASAQNDVARQRSQLKCDVTVPLPAVDVALESMLAWLDAGG